jgi:hypothetical protein
MGGIIGCLTVGQLQLHYQSRGLFFLTGATAAIVLVLVSQRKVESPSQAEG